PQRHAHPHAPGGVPGRGHLRPAAARDERAGPAPADRGRPAFGALRRPRPKPLRGGGVSAVALAEATSPPERRGVERDRVRLLVGRGTDGVEHAVMRDLPRLLDPGDLLVVNTSATLPAALDALAPGGRPLRLHLSTPLPGS